MNGGTAIEGDKPQMMEQKERRDCRRGGRTVSDRKRRAAGLLAGLPALCMELLFPARCPFCDAVLGFSGPCAACEEKLRTARRAPAAPVPAQGHEMRFMDAVYAPYFYESMVQNAILRMKFHGRPDLARPLAGRMAGALREAAPFARAELIVPVPSGRRELRRRGYDVPLALARLLGAELRVPVAQALCKTRETTPQATLSGEARRRNLHGAFAVHGAASVEGRHIVLVDDVYTTGATLDACAGALKAAGAASCTGACIAAVR